MPVWRRRKAVDPEGEESASRTEATESSPTHRNASDPSTRSRAGESADRGEQVPTAGRGARQQQREEFGGFKLGAALLGWLIAIVLTVVLTAIAGAITGLIGAGTGPPAAGSVGIAAIVSAVVGLVILALAYFLGGYVAGRLARFNGPKQGLGVWLIGVALTVILAVAGVVLGAQFNVLAQLNLPTIPLDPGSLTIGGLIALVVILVATLLAAMAGGKAGTRYHRKVDDAGHSS